MINVTVTITSFDLISTSLESCIKFQPSCGEPGHEVSLFFGLTQSLKCGVRVSGTGPPVCLLHSVVDFSKAFQHHPCWSQVPVTAPLEVTVGSFPFHFPQKPPGHRAYGFETKWEFVAQGTGRKKAAEVELFSLFLSSVRDAP